MAADLNGSHGISDKNIVVCICQRPEQASDKSHINRTLELLQKQWAKEKNTRTHIAFVFGNGVTYARDFADLSDNDIFYVENCKEAAKLSHLWFMGMALLERKQAQDKREKICAQNFLYLLIDDGFNNVEAQKILSDTRFADLSVFPILVKSKDGAGGSLEDYIQRKGKVCLDTDICDEELIHGDMTG